MPTQRLAWKEAAWIFGTSRLVIVLISVIGAIRFPLARQALIRNCAHDPTCLLSWWHWDVLAYAGIAQHGYVNLQDTVFFPLWPLLLHGVATPFGSSPMSYYITGLLLANGLFYLALVVFYLLLSHDFDQAVARNALFYLAFAPYALYFFAGYSESLFLLLCLAAFFFLQHERYWLAGMSGFLAALTRSQGVLLVVPFLVVLVQRFWSQRQQMTWRDILRAFLPLILIPLGVGAYMLYLWIAKGNPLAFSTEEALFWHRHLTFPVVSLVIAFQTFFRAEVLDLHLLNTLDVGFTLLPLALLALGWRRLPLSYSLFALAMLLFDLSYPEGVTEPLTAAPRYLMVIFPVFVLLGIWGKRPRLDRLMLALFLPLFAINIVLFIIHYWVA
jgi:hypothetical protein